MPGSLIVERADSIPNDSSTSAAAVSGVAPSLQQAFVPAERRDVISPGTAKTSLPSSSAKSAVMSAPLRSRASTTTVAAHSPAMILFRAGKRNGAGSHPARTPTRAGALATVPASWRALPGSRGRSRSRARRPYAARRARRDAPRRPSRARDRSPPRALRRQARDRACAHLRAVGEQRGHRRSRPRDGRAVPGRQHPAGTDAGRIVDRPQQRRKLVLQGASSPGTR